MDLCYTFIESGKVRQMSQIISTFPYLLAIFHPLLCGLTLSNVVERKQSVNTIMCLNNFKLSPIIYTVV